jgi:hypothetical protein
MAGYIGSKASVVSSGAEHKKVFDITTTTTSLTGLVYTPTLVHVFHNGVRLVDGTDYTATSGTTITLTVAAENGDQVVVISYATFQTSDTVSASAGGTFAGDVNFGDNVKAIFGAGSDLQIYHNGADSVIKDAGTGSLEIHAANFEVWNASKTNVIMAGISSDGEARLYYGGSMKLNTSSTGIDITGDITPTGGVYLGGTVAANHLSDYEFGTWTPSSSDAGGAYYSNGKYVKVGGSVFIQANLGNIGGGIDFGSLPFVPNDTLTDSPTIIGDKPMALTEATLQDKIEIVGDYKHVQVRTATVISRDGIEISRSFSRHVVGPLDDISGESAEVQAICAVVHTDAIKEAYTELLAQQALGV